MKTTRTLTVAAVAAGVLVLGAGPAFAADPALPADGMLSGLGLGGIADTVCDLLHGLLGSAADSGGPALP
ncbi:hypothetical protein [Streptomyces boncukensis]|uniref:Secreted protein n=1 Tax=Streptomyces boncukensis TaxID=2711219 RepID=A0A6G4WQA3_9ACTN|nr:hypothetical protein [Streptomyces boncukensis]NGO67449.1 hypothetical protein [Streptomyces boncukensis]